MHLRQAISRLFLNGKTSPSVVNGARLFSANSGGGEGRNGWDNVVGWDSDSIRASDAKENPEVYTIEKLAKDYRIMRQRVHAILWLKQIEEEEENKLGWDSDSIRASDAKENPEVYTIEKLAKDYRIMRQRVHAILWLKQIEEEEEKKLGHPLDDSVELLLDTCPEKWKPLGKQLEEEKMQSKPKLIGHCYCSMCGREKIEPGVLLLLNNCLVLEVKDVHRYPSFLEMLEAESLPNVLPGVKTIEEGVKIYRQFCTEEKEMSNGVIAICVSNVSSQPYHYMGNILSGLGYGGVQSLLGLVNTSGTVFDALPPPRSALLSSFALTYKPKVKGSALTHGARALAKHAERSGNKYWGILSGNDDTKTRLAKNVINCLIASCRWSNVHIVPQHGCVYEIRTADGYGARWSNDGTKFIGFLEPYMEDGYSKGAA